MSETITFEYFSIETLTVASPVLKAGDLSPKTVVKSTGSYWKVSYLLSDVMQKTSRINALYNIFCSSLQNTTYNSETFTQLRIDFCLQPETYPSLYCPTIEDFNELKTNTCSRLYSTNNDFNDNNISNKVQCAGLVQYLDVSSSNDTMKAAVQNGYKKLCENNKDMRECQCYNRANFSSYQNAKSILSSGTTLQSGNECCWYVPCQFQTNITVDPVIQNAYDRVACPSVCQNIVAAVNVKNAVFSDISLSNNCIGSTQSDVEKDISDNVDKIAAAKLFQEQEKKKYTTTITPTKAFVMTRQNFIYIVVGGIVFVVVVMMIILLMASKDKPSPMVRTS